MQEMTPILLFVLGVLVGGAAVFFILRVRGREEAIRMVDTFKAIAADALHQNASTFLQMAESKLQQKEEKAAATLDKKTVAIDAMIKPVQDTLQTMNAQLQALEVKREGAYRELAEMVSASRESQTLLRKETSQLLQALRTPTARGRWGEMQLQRILEMTGMSEHAKDFAAQGSVSDHEGSIRPDFVVALPGERCVVIDSKVPLSAYLDSVQTDDETTRQNSLKSHARQLKDHIKVLSGKAYWEKVEGTPEFVVLFLPGEHFLSAALDGDADLMEFSAKNKVVLATPMTLIALLRTVAHGWRQAKMHENMLDMVEAGRKLYGSLIVFTKHMNDMGSRLGSSVEVYNKMIASFDGNVMVKARKFEEFGVVSGASELATPRAVEYEPRLTVVENTPRTVAEG